MGKIERMGSSGKKGNGGGVVGGRKQEGKREKMRKKKKGGGQRERELGGASLGEKTGCWEAFTSSRWVPFEFNTFLSLDIWHHFFVDPWVIF